MSLGHLPPSSSFSICKSSLKLSLAYTRNPHRVCFRIAIWNRGIIVFNCDLCMAAWHCIRHTGYVPHPLLFVPSRSSASFPSGTPSYVKRVLGRRSATRWSFSKHRHLKAWPMTVMCAGYAPVSSRKHASEKCTFWYESSAAPSVVARGREAGGAREAQVGLAFGCCGVRGGVAASGKGKGASVGRAMLSEKERVQVPVRVSAVLPARV